MDQKQEQDVRFLELAIEHETAMAELYDTFHNIVPCSTDLWKSLSNEEVQHAQRLQVLLYEVQQGNARLAPMRHNAKIIEASLATLKERTIACQRAGITIKEAFEYALLLEGGIIEDAIFSPLEGDSPLAAKILWEMNSGTGDHFSRIREEYEKNSYGAGFIKHLAATFKSFLRVTEDSK